MLGGSSGSSRHGSPHTTPTTPELQGMPLCHWPCCDCQHALRNRAIPAQPPTTTRLCPPALRPWPPAEWRNPDRSERETHRDRHSGPEMCNASANFRLSSPWLCGHADFSQTSATRALCAAPLAMTPTRPANCTPWWQSTLSFPHNVGFLGHGSCYAVRKRPHARIDSRLPRTVSRCSYPRCPAHGAAAATVGTHGAVSEPTAGIATKEACLQNVPFRTPSP